MAIRRILLIAVLMCLLTSGHAHVPYIEGKDFSSESAFRIDNIIQSKAFYAYLDEADVDEYIMLVTEPVRIYIHMLIPFCREYARYSTTYALSGPGLPSPGQKLPVELPKGHGALIWDPDYEDWSERPFMYEYFSDRQYFEGIRYQYEAETPGEYRLIVWHKNKQPGDYIAIIGRSEEFSVQDMQLAYANTPVIREHKEMRGQCTYEGDFSDWFAADK